MKSAVENHNIFPQLENKACLNIAMILGIAISIPSFLHKSIHKALWMSKAIKVLTVIQTNF